jgi:hypothetical protein
VHGDASAARLELCDPRDMWFEIGTTGRHGSLTFVERSNSLG